jgi:5-methylthioadenosine/S-adenosylhomocysteine deaminase
MRATRYTAHWVLPIVTAPIENGAVLVAGDGRIVAVGPLADVPQPADAENVHLGDAALLPGLVNVHAHPELTALRGLLEDLSFEDWIGTLLRIKRTARLDQESWEIAAQWACLEAMSAGITTMAATEDSAAAFRALIESGLRGIVYQEVFGPDPHQADAAMAMMRTRLHELRGQETALVRAGVSPHAAYTVSDTLFTRAAEFALVEQLPVAVHAAEAAAEEAYVTRGNGPFADSLRARGIAVAPRGRSTIDLLDRTGVLATRPLLIHCVRVVAEDIARIRDAGATIAHCPTANARLAHGVAPVMELLEAGVTVGLGSDSMASNNRMDILHEAHAAQLLQRARSACATALPSAQALRLATLDGARALGLDGRIGSLEIGKDADLCAVALSAAHIAPVHDPAAALVHAARAADVIRTVVRGRTVYAYGESLTLSAASLRLSLDRVARKLAAALHAS